MTPSRRLLAAIATVTCAAACVGCGSTVSADRLARQPAATVSTDLAARPTPQATSDASGQSPRPSDPGTDDTSGLEPSSPPRPDAGVRAQPGPSQAANGGSAATRSGRGFSATNANLGITYVSGGDSVAQSFGFNLSTGDMRSFAEQLLELINTQGRVAGRTITGVFHEVKASSASSDPASATQAMCSDFTQDHQVFAVVNGAECLATAKIPYTITAGQNAADKQEFTRLAPFKYDPNIMNSDDVTRLLLDRAIATGFLTTRSKIGVFSSDNPIQQRIINTLGAQLKARGLTVAASFAYDGSNTASVASTGGAGVLKFKNAGVDRVVSFDANVGLFMIAAQQQGYKPKYALTTYLNLASVQEAVAPPQQLAGSFGIGWMPRNDLNEAQQYPLPGTALCKKALAASGQQNATGSAAFILYSYCDSIRLLIEGARAGGTFTAEALRAGLNRDGAHFPTALNLAPAYTNNRYDGARTVRDIGYNTSCSCFRYLGGTQYGS